VFPATLRGGCLASPATKPSIDVSGAYIRQRRSEHVPASGAVEQNLFQSGFDASWEIDLFGGVRRSIEAANAGIAAAQEGLRDTLVSLLAEVARNDVEVRGFQQRLAITQENIHSQQETLALTRARFDAGLTSELMSQRALLASQSDLAQSEAAVSSDVVALYKALGGGRETLAPAP
jgi:outer membrane protein, multidrug efflux system